jgi:translocation and assembly module TamB
MISIRSLNRLLLLVALLVWPAAVLLAQEEDEKSGLIRFVEEKLSAPNRQISLNGIQGTLSSNVSFDSITIADEEGVWLVIVNPTLQWSRTSLLTGKLDIQSLTADRIDWPRMPVADDSLPSPESTGFQLPELPVSVVIDELQIEAAEFGEPVFGLASTLSLDGNISLENGNLASNLNVVRLDGPGGSLALQAGYSNATTQLDIELSLQEPQDGVLANLLNIPERPPIDLTVAGSGPLDDLDVNLTFDAGGERIAAGTLSLSDTLLTDDRRAILEVSGPIEKILPEEHRAFFGSETALNADVLLRSGGGFDLRQFQLDSGALEIKASGTTLQGGFPRQISADINLRSQNGEPVRLPLSGDPVTIGGGTLSLRYGDRATEGWTLSGRFDNVAAPNIDIAQIGMNGSGKVTNLQDAATRAVTFDVNGNANGLRPTDPGLAAALGDSVALSLEGGWNAGKPVELTSAILVGDTLRVESSGMFTDLAFKGKTRIEAADLAAFSVISDRSLSGSAALDADGRIALAGGGFDLEFTGSLTDAGIDQPVADRLLAGEMRLSGSAARSPDGLRFRALNLSNNQVKATIDGLFASTSANLRANAEIFEMALVAPDASGRLALDATIIKPAESDKKVPYDVDTTIKLTSAQLQSRSVPNAEIGFKGQITGSNIRGDLSGTGLIGGETIAITGALAKTGDRITLNDFLARIGLSRLEGDIAYENGLADGKFSIASNDISALAALALADASGAVNGGVTLSSEDGRQGAIADLKLMNARYQKYRVGQADFEATLRDLFGAPNIQASINGKNIEAAGVAIDTLTAKAGTRGKVIDFDAEAGLNNGTQVRTNGSLETIEAGFDATLEQLAVESVYGDARLTRPTRISRSGDVTSIKNLEADVAGGSVTASGTVAETVSLNASFSGIPLSIVNGFRPDLGLGGTLSGSVDVTGKPGNPQAAFTISGSGVDVAALRSVSVSPIDVSANGSYRRGAVNLNSLTARNSQNLDFSGSGSIPFSGPGLSVQINGSVPLGFAERFLVERGTRMEGTLRIDASVTGSLSAPNADGLFSLSGASITDPLTNLRLSGIGGVAGLRGDVISINRFSGQLAGGGTVAVSGKVGLSGGNPANLTIALRNATYSDAETIRTTLSGDLSVTGQLTAGPLVSGQIDLLGTEITIPETIAGDADLLEVRHIDPDSGTQRTLRRIQAVLPRDGGNAPQAPVRLDVTVNSPNRIFVRGRGIDAEFGGRLRVTGPLTALQPVGSFNLIRGRLSILSKRLDLTEGRITLTGSLDPLISLLAQVNGDDITAYIRLTGRASDLSLDLSASPELPEDEILARVLFGKGISSLSPLQIANLATAAASLASGGSGAGLSDHIRNGLGVDDLDITQDSEGNVGVRAGKYIQDNVYLDVQAGSGGGEVSINLDITDSLTAKGSVDTDGDSKLGIFFEKDY